MSVLQEWPEYCPDPDVTIDVTAGTLTLVAGAVIANPGEFDLAAPDLTAAVWKNGARVSTISIAANGALTLASAVSVAQNDRVEVWFRYAGRLSLPWLNRLIWERVLIFDVPAGNVQHRFGPSHVRLPIPTLEIAFGWDTGTNKLRVGVKPTATDGATQPLVIHSRLIGAASTTTNVTLSSATQQTHDSAFVFADTLMRDAEVELRLASATTGARQEGRAKIAFQAPDNVPAWSSATVRLYHTKVGGAGKLSR